MNVPNSRNHSTARRSSTWNCGVTQIRESKNLRSRNVRNQRHKPSRSLRDTFRRRDRHQALAARHGEFDPPEVFLRERPKGRAKGAVVLRPAPDPESAANPPETTRAGRI